MVSFLSTQWIMPHCSGNSFLTSDTIASLLSAFFATTWKRTFGRFEGCLMTLVSSRESLKLFKIACSVRRVAVPVMAKMGHPNVCSFESSE